MSKFKGTKGNWEYFVKHGGSTKRTWIQVIIPNQKTIDIDYLSKDDCNVPTCCAIETHANALLISKAPEMLEMLEELLKELRFHGFNNSTAINNAKQLIKKATEL